MSADSKKIKNRSIGIALGSGSARGWAHIGVLQALTDAGIEPDIVCGASVGALVGAVYAHNRLNSFGDWARELNLIEIVRYMDIRLVEGGGFVQGAKSGLGPVLFLMRCGHPFLYRVYSLLWNSTGDGS